MSEGAHVDLIDTAPRVSNRRLVLVGVVILVVAALVLGTSAVVNTVYGGARSPQSLARRLVKAVDAGRTDEVLALVEPGERQAAVRLVSALDADLTRWGLQEVFGGTAGSVASAVDGVTVRLDGVSARTELRSDGVAVLTFDTGRAQVSVDPTRTHGVLRAYLEARRVSSPTDDTVSLAGVDGGAGVRVTAVREGHRWYVSRLELGRASSGHISDAAYRYTDAGPSFSWPDILARTHLSADAAIAQVGALTREQVLALTGRARLDSPTGRLVPDREEMTAFTSAGYAVQTLHVVRAGLYRVAPGPEGTNRSTIYDPDGSPSIQPFYPNDSVYRLDPGDHTLLVWADDAFADVLSGVQPGPYQQVVEVRRVDAG